jgi:hypothetical protein
LPTECRRTRSSPPTPISSAKKLATIDWHLLSCERSEVPLGPTFSADLYKAAQPIWAHLLVIGENRYRVSSSPKDANVAWLKIVTSLFEQRVGRVDQPASEKARRLSRPAFHACEAYAPDISPAIGFSLTGAAGCYPRAGIEDSTQESRYRATLLPWERFRVRMAAAQKWKPLPINGP